MFGGKKIFTARDAPGEVTTSVPDSRGGREKSGDAVGERGRSERTNAETWIRWPDESGIASPIRPAQLLCYSASTREKPRSTAARSSRRHREHSATWKVEPRLRGFGLDAYRGS